MKSCEGYMGALKQMYIILQMKIRKQLLNNYVVSIFPGEEKGNNIPDNGSDNESKTGTH